jgi:hypothetical protein
MSTAAVTLATAIPGEHVRVAMNKDTEPFWQAAKERRLVAPQCAVCGTFRLPPTPFCPNCQSKSVNWVDLGGDAIVYSFAVVHGFPGMPDLVLVPAVLDLPDAPGARLVSDRRWLAAAGLSRRRSGRAVTPCPTTALCTRSPSSSSPASPTPVDPVTVSRSCPSMVISVVRARAATGTSRLTTLRKGCGKQGFTPEVRRTRHRELGAWEI